jgi:hypothetical protein
MTIDSPISIALIGTLAAWIAGVFSLLGLIISKDQKTSEFRQEWIDELRLDIAIRVAHAHQIHAYSSVRGSGTDQELWTATREDFIQLNKASTRIKLRLNHNEAESKLLLRSMLELESLFRTPLTIASLGEINKIVDSIERDAPIILKTEWTRVKNGEPIYYWARWIAGALSVLLIVA